MTSSSVSLVMAITLLSVIVMSMAVPLDYEASQSAVVEIDKPDQLVRVIQNLLRNILASQEIKYSADKRGLDLGLSRGFSGQRAAKHLVGLSNAEFAGGPGKR